MMLKVPLPKRGITLFTILFSCVFFEVVANETNDKDPFASLGIPDLSPKQLLAEIEQDGKKRETESNSLPPLKTIEDLPNFLKNVKLNEDEAISILTRFLIQDDFTLKKYGVVYDQSGFDGLSPGEKVGPVGTEERLVQRARSAANIWFKEKFPKLEYDAYGAENQLDEIVPNWRIYKVLMIGKNGENTFLKVCLPLDESETALCSDKDESCGQRTEYVDKEKKKNEDYISRIRSGNFFKNKSAVSTVKLLPGEKIKAKQNEKEIVLDSSTIQYKFNELNSPSMQSSGDSKQNKGMEIWNNNLSNNNLGISPYFMNFPNPQFPNMNHNLRGFPSFNSLNQPLSNMNSFNLNFPSTASMVPTNNGGMTYNYKQKEGVPLLSPSQVQSPMIGNPQMMKELLEMKKQLAEIMNSLKQKDMIISQQNMKLSSLGIANDQSVSSPSVNSMTMSSLFSMNMNQGLYQKSTETMNQGMSSQVMNLGQTPNFFAPPRL